MLVVLGAILMLALRLREWPEERELWRLLRSPGWARWIAAGTVLAVVALLAAFAAR